MATGIKVLCWFARTVCENLYSISSYLSTSGTSCLQHKRIIHAATQCTHGKFHALKLMSLLQLHANTFQVNRSLGNLSPCSLPSLSLITMLPRDGQCSTWWLIKWLLLAQISAILYCEWLYYYYIRFGMARLQAARCPVVRSTLGIVDTRDTCAVSQYFLLLRYTAVYRDVSIDDKYRGIAGIAQHY